MDYIKFLLLYWNTFSFKLIHLLRLSLFKSASPPHNITDDFGEISVLMFCAGYNKHSILIKSCDVFLWHPTALKCGAKWLGLRRDVCSVAPALELCACMWTRQIHTRSTQLPHYLRGRPARSWETPARRVVPGSAGRDATVTAVSRLGSQRITRLLSAQLRRGGLRASKHRDKFPTWEVRNKRQVMSRVKCEGSAVLTLFRV